MRRPELKRLYKKAVDKWGLDAQLGILQEECAELISAVSKVVRSTHSSEYYENLAEEIADVEIMCEQIKLHVTWQNLQSQVAFKKEQKLMRLKSIVEVR